MSNNINNFKELLKTYSVKIPIIQRDYAQGRNDGKTEKIREKFLNSIFDALKSGENLHLDFVYGSVKNNIFTPLDGQQRLTTLFLLHLYFGENTNLNKFSYETRASSREFCEKLIENMREIKKEFLPDTDDQAKKTYISEQIKDRPWFMAFWEQDPTVKSMLTMLDDICQKANENKINPENLDKLTFSLLKISDFGLDDDLYIKMNARGKPLNEFENFKAEFEKFLDNKFKDKAENIAIAIDTIWTDNFFAICKDPEKTFEAMVNYKDFIFEMLFHKNIDLDSKSTLDDVNNGKNDFDKVFNNIDDLEFLNFAFENINEILKDAKEIFDVYWDGNKDYNKENKVCVFDDEEDNFYGDIYTASLGGSKTPKKYNIFEIMPFQHFNNDHKIFLYSLILLMKIKDENRILKLTKIRNNYNKEMFYWRSSRWDFERKGIDNFNKQVKKAIDIIQKDYCMDENLQKMKKFYDYKYLKGNIDILDNNPEIGNKIIKLFNQPTHVAIKNLIYHGFKGWVLGYSYGSAPKTLFGGTDTWHMILTRDTDRKWQKNSNDFGGLKEVLKNLNIAEIKTNFKEYELKEKGFYKDSWEYYFIKYSGAIFDDNKNLIVWYDSDSNERTISLSIKNFDGVNPSDHDKYTFGRILKSIFENKNVFFEKEYVKIGRYKVFFKKDYIEISGDKIHLDTKKDIIEIIKDKIN